LHFVDRLVKILNILNFSVASGKNVFARRKIVLPEGQAPAYTVFPKPALAFMDAQAAIFSQRKPVFFCRQSLFV
jgi:hypothetical protein